LVMLLIFPIGTSFRQFLLFWSEVSLDLTKEQRISHREESHGFFYK